MDLTHLSPPGTRFAIHVTPRARRPGLSLRDGVLRVAVNAPPADGAANAAVIKMLAGAIGVPKSRLRIVSGHGARDKRVEVLA